MPYSAYQRREIVQQTIYYDPILDMEYAKYEVVGHYKNTELAQEQCNEWNIKHREDFSSR